MRGRTPTSGLQLQQKALQLGQPFNKILRFYCRCKNLSVRTGRQRLSCSQRILSQETAVCVWVCVWCVGVCVCVCVYVCVYGVCVGVCVWCVCGCVCVCLCMVCVCVSLSLRLYETRLEDVQEVRKPLSIFLDLLHAHIQTEKHDESNPKQICNISFLTHDSGSPYSYDAFSQQFDSQNVQQTLSAAEPPDCPGAHPASNSKRNALLSPD